MNTKILISFPGERHEDRIPIYISSSYSNAVRYIKKHYHYSIRENMSTDYDENAIILYPPQNKNESKVYIEKITNKFE